MFKKLCLTLALLSGSAFATEQPIKIIMPYASGGAGDVLSRLVQKTVGETTKKVIVIEQKLGAGGEIAAEYVAKYNGNESMFLWGASPLASYNAVKNSSYDINDLKPVAYLGHIPMVLVSSKRFQYQSLKGWKNIPADTTIFYGSAGNNTSSHLVGELLKQRTGKNLVQVPYKGLGPVIPALLSGTVDVAFMPWNLVLPHIDAGNLVPLAVISDQRLQSLPNTPTFNELNYKNFGLKLWFMILAGPSAKTEDIAIMQTALIRILSSPELSAPFRKAGLEYNVDEINRADVMLDRERLVYQKLYKNSPELIPEKK